MKNLSILFATFIFLAACNKEPHYKTVYLDAGLKTAFNNKTGSYWIYKDSLTGEQDSLFLVSNEVTIDEGYTTIYGKKFERMQIEYNSKHIGPDTSYSLHLALVFSTRERNRISSGLNGISIQPLNIWFSYPFNYLGSIDKNDTVVYSKKPEPFVLASNQFETVTIFSQYTKEDLSEKSTGYWSDQIGLIKMRFLCKSSSGPAIRVLELQRWKLIK